MNTHSRSRKAVSPLISAVILIAIIFAIASVVSPWAFNLATDVANETTSSVDRQITCQGVAYDFDTNYMTSGISYDLSGAVDRLEAKVVNTGTVNLHSFSIEIELNATSGIQIKYLDINSTYQKTVSQPLKPGQSAILKALFTEDLNGTLREVKVINGPCPSSFITITV